MQSLGGDVVSNDTMQPYAISYDEVRYDNNLSEGARLLFIEILKLSMQTGYCWASNKYFADLYNASETKIKRQIRELTKCGYLEVSYEYIEGTKSIAKRFLKVNLPGVKNDPTYGQICPQVGSNLPRGWGQIRPGGGVKSDPHNNINNNNINIINKNYNKKKSNAEIEQRFDEFWKEYPKKVNKQNAIKIWNKIKPDAELFDEIMNKLKIFKASSEWVKDNGKYIPYPSTWLNGKRWEDETEIAQQTKIEGTYL